MTGATRPQRDEAKGGIIADDMGLGKTLVVISAVAGSLNKATDFVSNHGREISTSSNVLPATRATLIIAPSTRKLLSQPRQYIRKFVNINFYTVLIDSWINEIWT